MTAFRALILSAFFLLGLTSGCGKGRNLGVDLALDVSPNIALLGPGPLSSCKDRTSSPIPRSLEGPVLSFNNLKLEWTSDDTLYVSMIRMRMDGGGLTNAVYEVILDAEEVEALVGKAEGRIVGKTVLNTSETTNRTGFPTCALRIGAVPLVNGPKTMPFRSRVTIEVVGYAENANGDQRFVKQKITANADYFGG